MLGSTILKIPKVIEVISECWKDAEAELISQIETKHFDLDEEVITTGLSLREGDSYDI